MGVSSQSKEGKCPWINHESTPWISEKPKKRGNEGKNKKLKNNYPIQPAKMADKEEILNPPFVEQDDGTGSISHKNRELGVIFPKMHDLLFSRTSDVPTVEVNDRRNKNVEVNSVELGALKGDKTNTVKDSTVTEPTVKVTDVSCQDQIQGAEFVPSVLSEENKTDLAKGHTAGTDKPNKRSSDGKCKKAKNSFSEKHILENKTDAAKIHVPMETTGDHRIEGMGYVDENRNITITCLRTLSQQMNKSAPLEAMESVACEKLPTPTPQVVKEGDALPDTLTKSGQERAPAQISRLLVDTCSENGIPKQENLEAPCVAIPSTSTEGIALTFTAARVSADRHGDHLRSLKSKGEFAVPRKNEGGIDKGHVVGESESGHCDTSKHSVQQITELSNRHILPGVPAEDHSLLGEVLEAHGNRGDFPASPVNKGETEKGLAPAHNPDLLEDKAQKLSFCESQNTKDRDSKGLNILSTEVDTTLFPPKSEKNKLKEISLACPVTKLECVSVLTPELQSDFSCGKVEIPPSGVVDKLVMTASKDLQLPELKDNIVEAPQKMTEKSEAKVQSERKKENKSRMAEPLKGYMRPTKSRGLTPLLPKSISQEGERSKQLKSSGMNLLWGNVCACGIKKAKSLCLGSIHTLIILVNHWFVVMKTCNFTYVPCAQLQEADDLVACFFIQH
jgi:hypothetical protein